MPVPVSQAATVASYVLKQKLAGRKHYPLVLMLEPLFRCNLACEGCGKIQFPDHILKKRVSAEKALAAAEECGAPMVSIAGGEPLIHPEIEEIVDGLIKQGRYIYLCTNALLLERALKKFKPNKQLSFSVHMDGLKEEHDNSVCREGTYEIALSAIKKAVDMGFRVTTNTTLFNNADPERVREFFDEMMEAGVEGMMLSPGYAYEKAPKQDIFLGRNLTKVLFKKILGDSKKNWQFNHSASFMAFLRGDINYECTPWGNPTYNVFGWQKPCYLLADGYVKTFKELIETTEWEKYGRAGKGTDERCLNCMVHCGHEATAVNDTFSPAGLVRFLKAAVSFRRPATFSAEELQLLETKPEATGPHACASSSGDKSGRDELMDAIAASRGQDEVKTGEEPISRN
ncbi:MAG: adenosyl-hopene transferase HpnH [Verrucomicrobiota bacterium]